MFTDPPRRPIASLSSLATAVVWIAVWPVTGQAQALLRSDLAARPMAMGGAAAASVSRASAVYHHPAGIVHLPGTVVEGNAFVSADDHRLRLFGDREFDEEDGPRFDGSFFITHRISQEMSGGIAVTSPWFLDIEWERPDTFAGRFRASKSHLRSTEVSPVLAFGPFGRWSAAIGVSAFHADLDLDRFEQDPALSALGGGGPIALAETAIGMDATGIGWTASVAFQPEPRVALGAQYRSEVEVVFSGLSDFTVVAPAALRAIVLPGSEETVGEMLDQRFVDQSVRVPFVFPRQASAGLVVRPMSHLEVAFDARWTDWGAIDSLAILYADSALSETARWPHQGAWGLHAGAEIEARSGMKVRFGYAWQESSGPALAVTPINPMAGSDSYTAGVGLQWRALGVDVGYRLTVFEDAEGFAFPDNTTAIDGVFEGIEHSVAFGLSRMF